MASFRLTSIVAIFACILLTACIGASNSDKPEPAYFINDALLGQYGIARTIKATGTDSAGRGWTLTWTSERALSRCQPSGDADMVSYSRLLARDGSPVTNTGYDECWTHNPFQLTNLWYTSGPDNGYSWQLFEAGNLSSSADIGTRGTLGGWFLYDNLFVYAGYVDGAWSFEAQNDHAALVLIYDRHDLSGVLVAREIQRFVIAGKEDLTGTLVEFSIDMPLPDGEMIHLSTG